MQYEVQINHIPPTDSLKLIFMCLQVGLQRTLCGMTGGQKFLFVDHHTSAANGESAAVVYSL
jgi:hypothetical protein